MAKILLITARFYDDIAQALMDGAVAELEKAGRAWEEIAVPGALEIPAAIRMAIASGNYDGYVALGCVIRGETTHYDYVCGESARGLNELAIEHMAPIGNGILTVENREQAMARADVNRKNKGGGAAQACLAMLAIRQQLLGKGEKA